jgi:hypothetical protein
MAMQHARNVTPFYVGHRRLTLMLYLLMNGFSRLTDI